MIQAPAVADRIARPARTHPDDRIADDGAGTGRGLRKQAGIAVGTILGLAADIENDGILGSAPWSGRTLDPREADDAVEALENTVAAASGLGKLGREFEAGLSRSTVGNPG